MTKRRRKVRKSDLAGPSLIFYIECDEDSEDGNVWFVNNSEETLKFVTPEMGGFSGEVHLAQETDSLFYENVEPGEAVLIGTYDFYYDLDFVMSWGVQLASEERGVLTLTEVLSKGEAPNIALLWAPLPDEMKDPENPERLIEPEQVAREYVARTGCSLSKLVPLNTGDLMQDYAAKRLAPTKLQLNKSWLRGGKNTYFKFYDEAGEIVFQTVDTKRAMQFVSGLRK